MGKPSIEYLRVQAQAEVEKRIYDKWAMDEICKRMPATHRLVLAEVASLVVIRAIEDASVEVFHRMIKEKKDERQKARK